MNTFFTSESVTCGHPDKVCDQIADRILDEMLAQDPESRSACEVTCATNQVHIFGEVTTTAKGDYEAVARKVKMCIRDRQYRGQHRSGDGGAGRRDRERQW